MVELARGTAIPSEAIGVQRNIGILGRLGWPMVTLVGWAHKRGRFAELTDEEVAACEGAIVRVREAGTG